MGAKTLLYKIIVTNYRLGWRDVMRCEVSAASYDGHLITWADNTRKSGANWGINITGNIFQFESGTTKIWALSSSILGPSGCVLH